MVEVGICRWFRGKKAAFSLRFDDAHPTHVEKAVPMLNERGFVGTFLINPGNKGYNEHRADWEGPIIQQGHELGDHTLHHRGARTDREAEEQIGGCAEVIWRLQPERGKLLAFQQGGATVWLQRKPLDFFLAKYALFQPGASMSCSEAYPSFTLDAFKERLSRALAAGDWLQTHFHGIDAGHLYISTPVFLRLLDHVRAHRAEVWQTGMASAHKYQQERDHSLLLAHPAGDDALALRLLCATDPRLYNHPLTLNISLPPEADGASVLDAAGNPVQARTEEVDGQRLLRFEAEPLDAAYTVRGRGLGTAYLKTHGPDLPPPGPRPYLFFTREDLPSLRQKMTRPPASAMWERVRAEADRLLRSDPPGQPTGQTTYEQARASSNALRVLSAVHALAGEPACARRATPEIEVILAADSWSHPQHKAEADLVSAEIACSLGLAYDWLHDALSEDQRHRVREAIVRRGLRPIVEATQKRAWWTHWRRCNWGAVIFGQAGVAALSLLPDEPEAADWVRLCREKLWRYGQALGRDGDWGESVSYACYAWFNATLFMDALHRVTGGRIDLFDNPRLRRFPEWFIHLLTPDESGFVPFSNCGKGAGFPGQFLYRLARTCQDGRARWIAQRMASQAASPNLFGFLWCDPDLQPQPPADLPLSKIFQDIDWAVLRSRWEDPQATLFALKGGQKDWDHQHHDTNHFVLYAYGKPLIVDLFYPHEIWGCETEAHNTILVNNRDQRGRVRVQGNRGEPDHRGVVAGPFETPWHARLVGDASLAYEQDDVSSFVREVIYLRRTDESAPSDYFLLFDDVDARAPARMDWLLHTYGELAVHQNCITVTQDDAAADITLLAPEAFECEVHEKPIEETGAPRPFEGAEKVRFLKLRPSEPVQRGYFLSVLAPRPASTLPSNVVTAVRGPNTLGARILHGAVEDLALFAQDPPEMDASGVSAVGRSCLVRRVNGRIADVALHNGQRLSADGDLMFETNSSGHAALTIADAEVTARLDIYDGTKLALFAPRRPVSVLADGQEQAFDHDPESRCVRFPCRRVREVRVLFS